MSSRMSSVKSQTISCFICGNLGVLISIKSFLNSFIESILTSASLDQLDYKVLFVPQRGNFSYVYQARAT